MAGTALRSPCGGDGQKIRSRGAGAGGGPSRFPLRRRACAPPGPAAAFHAGGRRLLPSASPVWRTLPAAGGAASGPAACRGPRRRPQHPFPVSLLTARVARWTARRCGPSGTRSAAGAGTGTTRPRGSAVRYRAASKRPPCGRGCPHPRERGGAPRFPAGGGRAPGRPGGARRPGRPADPVRRGPGSGPRRRGSSPAPAAGTGTADGARTPGRVAVRSPFTCMAHRSRAARGSRPRSNPGRPRTPGRPSHHPAQSPDRTGTDDAPLGPPGPEGDA